MSAGERESGRSAQSRPRVLLVATGGTIGSLSSLAGLEAGQTAKALARSIAELTQNVELLPIDACQVLSHAMTPTLMNKVAHEIDRGLRSGVDGVVVTHGTDTIEETAYALALQLKPRVPVVLTGAMRTSGVAGSDGAANLIAAIRVALTPRAASLGALVVIQDEVHLARWVTKVHTSRVAAIASPELGPVGVVVEDAVHLHIDTCQSEFLGLPERLEHRVEVLFASAGADGALVNAARAYAHGIVVAGTGGGHVPPEMARSLREAARDGLPIVLTSRTGAGPLLRGTYGGPGSERDLYELGAILAHSLSPAKARLRLIVALALGIEPRTAFMARWGGQ